MVRPYSPNDPIHLDPNATTQHEWEGTDQFGNRLSAKCDDTDQDTRKRMVDDDGQSPLLFTNLHGRPLSAQHFSQLVQTSRKNARKKNKAFPKIRFHDLRHTYCTHLAVYFHDQGYSNPVGMVSMSVGHLSPKTTTAYTQALQAHLRAGRPVDDYLWGCK